MRYAIVLLVVLPAAMALGTAACSSTQTSSSSGSTSGGTDGGGGEETGSSGDAGTDTGADAGPLVVNNCKSFDDRTGSGAARTIAWQFPLASAERCMRIKRGQSVTWSGDFAKYPVAASRGSTEPNPIKGFDGSSPTVAFPNAGTFGFDCPDFPALLGAIEVVE
ncbi:MAG: hypothetical protein JST00_46860 [Deltaproteobacteria bacterium]|nr:hypothetical protein [Deltaproteobacteria bacterium]